MGLFYTSETNIINRLIKLTDTGNFDFVLDTVTLSGVITNVSGTLVTMKNGFSGAVQAMLIDSSGKIYVGGSFTFYNGIAATRIIRLNSDGSIDTGFSYGTGFNNTLTDIKIDSSGKIYIGGQFTDYNGTAANRIIRLNTDGTVDTGFAYGTGFNSGLVNQIEIDSSDKIYVVGTFTSYNGTSANRIIKLNTDGTIDTGFAYGTGFNNIGQTLAIDSSGKLYVGGNFTTYNGTAANRIIKLNTNGTIDTGFVYGTGFNTLVNTIKIDSGGKLYIGGDYATYNGTAASRIVKLNTDGTIDTGFAYGTGFNTAVRSIVIDSSSKLYVGGNFITYQGTSANRIIRLNTDGTIDTGFVYGTGFDGSAIEISIDSSGKILIAGAFVSYNGL